MRIEICFADDGHMMPRLARKIAAEMDDCFAVGLQPTLQADVALFLPYAAYEQRRRNLAPHTVTMAWFTHFETASPGKMSAWHKAAKVMDVRIVTAPVYAERLAAHGPTRIVTPGVDTDTFNVRNTAYKGYLGRVGTTFVNSPRKRPDIAMFLLNALDGEAEVAAHVVPNAQHVNYVGEDEMVNWYRQIEVYVCTSTEEGIPMPVLEAMACGCKVVMPVGVGIEPKLPVPGVWRYEAGDAVDCLRATREALADRKVTRGSCMKRAKKLFPFDNWATGISVVAREAHEKAKSTGRI